jgi:hypothetical protein
MATAGGIGLTDIGLIDTGKMFLSCELMKQTGNFYSLWFGGFRLATK